MANTITEAGQLVNGKVIINTSTIFSRLIQEAARWCECYASDIFHDLTNVQKAVTADIDDWKDITCDKTWTEGDGCYFISFRFGFRKNGVDHGQYIDNHFKYGGNKEHYRAIWNLTIKADARNGMAVATLQRMAD